MKININIFSDNNKYLNIHNTAISQNVPPKAAIKPFVSIYDKSNFYPCHINFSGGQKLLKKENFIFLTKGIICPYSGIEMVPKHIFEATLTEDALSGTGRAAIKALSQFEESMFDVEKNVFDQIRELSSEAPKASLSKILMLCRPDSLKVLQKAQHQTFDHIESLGRELQQDSLSKVALDSVLGEARKLIQHDSIGRIFKRKVFIAKLNLIKEIIPNERGEEKAVFNEICEVAKGLKTSQTNLSAFVVKYSRRSSAEIGQRLVEPSVSTFEHIVPDSEDGDMTLSNCLAVSKKFNDKRKNTPLRSFINLYPDIPQNCQRYMDCVIGLIRKHKYKEYVSYPQNIAARLFTESGGLIKLDYSKLGKLKPADTTGYVGQAHTLQGLYS